MATLNNPFVVYGYKGAEYFCDRQKETEKMISTLYNERNITLVAPRRMGKTGLIHHVFHQMEEQYEGGEVFLSRHLCHQEPGADGATNGF